MKKTNFQAAADVFAQWRDDVLTGDPPKLYPVGKGELARIEVGPKLITFIGGAPGAGKTAFTMQCVIDAGVGVIVVAAVARQKDKRGSSTYSSESLSLASYRESSELEFGADDAFTLSPKPRTDLVVLRHLKARHTETRDVSLRFGRKRQAFTATDTMGSKPMPDGTELSALSDAWDQIEPAADDAGGDAV